MGDTPAETIEFQALLDRALEGEEEAYGDLIVLATVRLQKLARRMLSDFPRLRRWEQTDDVFQTAAMKLHRSLSDVQPETVRQFFGLAATQIRRTLIDFARHHFGPEGHAAKHESDALHQYKGTKHGDSPDSLASWTEFHEQVELMPDLEREVFQLRWYAGMTYQEAATVLQVAERTVIRRYYRARLHLKSVLYSDEAVDV